MSVIRYVIVPLFTISHNKKITVHTQDFYRISLKVDVSIIIYYVSQWLLSCTSLTTKKINISQQFLIRLNSWLYSLKEVKWLPLMLSDIWLRGNCLASELGVTVHAGVSHSLHNCRQEATVSLVWPTMTSQGKVGCKWSMHHNQAVPSSVWETSDWSDFTKDATHLSVTTQLNQTTVWCKYHHSHQQSSTVSFKFWWSKFLICCISHEFHSAKVVRNRIL